MQRESLSLSSFRDCVQSATDHLRGSTLYKKELKEKESEHLKSRKKTNGHNLPVGLAEGICQHELSNSGDDLIHLHYFVMPYRNVMTFLE